MSSLQNRFEALTDASVLQMAGEFERQQLECKTVSDPGLTSRDDERNLAIALSAFANAEGGILLWGVEARKDSSGLDRIVGHPGISEPERLVSRLSELDSQALSPGVPGIEHRALMGATPFVATLVPPSDRGPHTAKLGEDRYYQRIGGSSLRMESFQLADMFGRRPLPELLVRFVQSSEHVLDAEVRNVGRGIALAGVWKTEVPPSCPRHWVGATPPL
jgi:predicted HTH transcriptional regulator